MEKLNVVFTIDDNYIQHFCVACTSLLENNKNIGRVFLVQSIKEDNSNLRKSIDYFKQKYNVVIEELSLDGKVLENFKINRHISKATYFRLLLAEILPNDINKVMFLDSDIVVKGDLSKLMEKDFSLINNSYIEYSDTHQNISYSNVDEYYIYAVNHKFQNKDLERLRIIGFEGNSYFNAGIMLINLKKWRDDNISTLLLENATKYNKHLLWWDQDVLNITFDKKWGELDFKYNAFDLDTKENAKDYKIVHYTGSSKPWHFRNKHPHKDLYWKYLKMTPFKRYIPEDLTVLNIIKWVVPRNIKKLIKG